MTRHHHSLLSAVAGCVLFSLVATAPALAQTSFRDTAHLTFSEPVLVPGQTLEPGEYVFNIFEKSESRSVAQIWNKDETELIAQVLVVPTRRVEDTGELAVEFSATAEGQPPALRSWFVPGQSIGHEFVYPEAQARKIAEATEVMVLSSDHDPKDVEGLAQASFYRVDRLGERHDYTNPESYDAMTGQEPGKPGPKALIDDIEKILDDALEADEAGEVSISRVELEKIQAHLERLREAITTQLDNQRNRRR